EPAPGIRPGARRCAAVLGGPARGAIVADGHSLRLGERNIRPGSCWFHSCCRIVYGGVGRHVATRGAIPVHLRRSRRPRRAVRPRLSDEFHGKSTVRSGGTFVAQSRARRCRLVAVYAAVARGLELAHLVRRMGLFESECNRTGGLSDRGLACVCARTVIPLAEALSGGMGAPPDRATFVKEGTAMAGLNSLHFALHVENPPG